MFIRGALIRHKLIVMHQACVFASVFVCIFVMRVMHVRLLPLLRHYPKCSVLSCSVFVLYTPSIQATDTNRTVQLYDVASLTFPYTSSHIYTDACVLYRQLTIERIASVDISHSTCTHSAVVREDKVCRIFIRVNRISTIPTFVAKQKKYSGQLKIRKLS